MVSSSKIQARGYETLYQFATANERSLFGRVVLRAPMRLRVTICSDCSCTTRPTARHGCVRTILIQLLCCMQPLVYMVMHMALVTLTFLLARLFWESFWAVRC